MAKVDSLSMAMFMSFMAILRCHVHAVQFSTISAAPAYLPEAPVSSPPSSSTLSPDIEPLFPTPGVQSPSPSESSMPTIPSSPSPPNPDDMLAPGPALALSPSENPLPGSFSHSLTHTRPAMLAFFVSLMVSWLVKVHVVRF